MTKIISFGFIVLLASIIFVRGFSSRSLACRRRAGVGHFLTVSAPDCPSQSRDSMRERNGSEMNVPDSQFAMDSMAENGETSGRRSVIM